MAQPMEPDASPALELFATQLNDPALAHLLQDNVILQAENEVLRQESLEYGIEVDPEKKIEALDSLGAVQDWVDALHKEHDALLAIMRIGEELTKLREANEDMRMTADELAEENERLEREMEELRISKSAALEDLATVAAMTLPVPACEEDCPPSNAPRPEFLEANDPRPEPLDCPPSNAPRPEPLEANDPRPEPLDTTAPRPPAHEPVPACEEDCPSSNAARPEPLETNAPRPSAAESMTALLAASAAATEQPDFGQSASLPLPTHSAKLGRGACRSAQLDPWTRVPKQINPLKAHAPLTPPSSLSKINSMLLAPHHGQEYGVDPQLLEIDAASACNYAPNERKLLIAAMLKATLLRGETGDLSFLSRKAEPYEMDGFDLDPLGEAVEESGEELFDVHVEDVGDKTLPPAQALHTLADVALAGGQECLAPGPELDHALQTLAKASIANGLDEGQQMGAAVAHEALQMLAHMSASQGAHAGGLGIEGLAQGDADSDARVAQALQVLAKANVQGGLGLDSGASDPEVEQALRTLASASVAGGPGEGQQHAQAGAARLLAPGVHTAPGSRARSEVPGTFDIEAIPQTAEERQASVAQALRALASGDPRGDVPPPSLPGRDEGAFPPGLPDDGSFPSGALDEDGGGLKSVAHAFRAGSVASGHRSAHQSATASAVASAQHSAVGGSAPHSALASLLDSAGQSAAGGTDQASAIMAALAQHTEAGGAVDPSVIASLLQSQPSAAEGSDHSAIMSALAQQAVEGGRAAPSASGLHSVAASACGGAAALGSDPASAVHSALQVALVNVSGGGAAAIGSTHASHVQSVPQSAMGSMHGGSLAAPSTRASTKHSVAASFVGSKSAVGSAHAPQSVGGSAHGGAPVAQSATALALHTALRSAAASAADGADPTAALQSALQSAAASAAGGGLSHEEQISAAASALASALQSAAGSLAAASVHGSLHPSAYASVHASAHGSPTRSRSRSLAQSGAASRAASQPSAASRAASRSAAASRAVSQSAAASRAATQSAAASRAASQGRGGSKGASDAEDPGPRPVSYYQKRAQELTEALRNGNIKALKGFSQVERKELIAEMLRSGLFNKSRPEPRPFAISATVETAKPLPLGDEDPDAVETMREQAMRTALKPLKGITTSPHIKSRTVVLPKQVRFGGQEFGALDGMREAAMRTALRGISASRRSGSPSRALPPTAEEDRSLRETVIREKLQEAFSTRKP